MKRESKEMVRKVKSTSDGAARDDRAVAPPLAKKRAASKPSANERAERAPPTKNAKTGDSAGKTPEETWRLRLYIAGETPKSVQAFANLKKICEEHLQGRYQIEVIDLLKNPTLARGDQILAVPTLVRQLPPPVKKIIGDFTNAERVLVGLNLVAVRGGAR